MAKKTPPPVYDREDEEEDNEEMCECGCGCEDEDDYLTYDPIQGLCLVGDAVINLRQMSAIQLKDGKTLFYAPGLSDPIELPEEAFEIVREAVFADDEDLDDEYEFGSDDDEDDDDDYLDDEDDEDDYDDEDDEDDLDDEEEEEEEEDKPAKDKKKRGK